MKYNYGYHVILKFYEGRIETVQFENKLEATKYFINHKYDDLLVNITLNKIIESVSLSR